MLLNKAQIPATPGLSLWPSLRCCRDQLLLQTCLLHSPPPKKHISAFVVSMSHVSATTCTGPAASLNWLSEDCLCYNILRIRIRPKDRWRGKMAKRSRYSFLCFSFYPRILTSVLVSLSKIGTFPWGQPFERDDTGEP